MNETTAIEEVDKSIEDAFAVLGENFLKEYDEIEVPSNLPDGTYTMLVTKSEVTPVQRGGNTVNLKFSAKVLTPDNLAGKIFLYDFTLSESNKTMMKKMFFSLGFEFDLRNQFAAFARLVGSELEVNLSTNGQYQNKNIRRVIQKSEVLESFLQTVAIKPEL